MQIPNSPIWAEQEGKEEKEEGQGEDERWEGEGRGTGILKNMPGDSSVQLEARWMVPAPFGT